jgi:hypothetical protein
MNLGMKQQATEHPARSHRPKPLALAAIAASLLIVGVGAPASASATRSLQPAVRLNPMNTVSKSNPLVLWVDPPRIPAVKAFEKAYPNIPVTVTTLIGRHLLARQLGHRMGDVASDQLRSQFDEHHHQEGPGGLLSRCRRPVPYQRRAVLPT